METSQQVTRLEGSLDDPLDLWDPHGVSGELTLESCPLIYVQEAREHLRPSLGSLKAQLVLTPSSAWPLGGQLSGPLLSREQRIVVSEALPTPVSFPLCLLLPWK